MTNEILHSVVLIITITLAFLFPKTNLVNYDLQISALLFVILFVSKRFLIPQKSASKLIESVIFTFVILLIVNTTGGAASPFFFLLFFLLFSLSLILEPIISIVITLALVIFFLLSLSDSQNFQSLLPIFSLAFLTPFALFMGQEHMKYQKSKIKMQNLEENTFLFLSLMLKNHIKNIKSAVENFMGDHELEEIKKNSDKMEKLLRNLRNQIKNQI